MYALSGILLSICLAAWAYLHPRRRRVAYWCQRLCFPLAGWLLLCWPEEALWRVLAFCPLFTMPALLCFLWAKPQWFKWMAEISRWLGIGMSLYLMGLFYALGSTPVTQPLPWWVPAWALRILFDYQDL